MPSSQQASVVFSPSGKRSQVELGTTVLQAARELGVDLDSICGGRARCGRCQVAVMDGEFPKEGIISKAAHLSPVTGDEIHCLKLGVLESDRRLGCQATIQGDVRIDVPAASQVHRQVVRKEFEAHAIELDPVIHLYFTDVGEPGQQTPDDDLRRLRRALENDWGLSDLDIDAGVLRDLTATLREEGSQVTVALRDDRDIVAAWPGLQEHVYGVAVDVGSTTIAAHLCDLTRGEVVGSAGAMNPQIRFGEDLMSRVSYAMLHKQGAKKMTTVVRKAVNELLDEVVTRAGVEHGEVLEITLVGNPVMHHLLLGLDPTPLGQAPFPLATEEAVEIAASALDLGLATGTRAYVLPCIAGHVGADTAAMMLAEQPWDSDEISLLMDIGTNAEIVLGNRDRLMAASSPTGPAFEGAQVSAGQRAAAGAIERVRIDPETLEPRFRVIGCDTWSDEPAFGDEVGRHGVTGICGSGIIEAIACMYLAGIIRADGTIDGSLAQRSPRLMRDGRTFAYLLHAGDIDIRIRQTDVRAIQLAKAALHAGARLLMERMGVKAVDRIRLAGAFGSLIDVKYAMVLGMIPDCELERVSTAGNAAGTGARIALLSRSARREIEQRVRNVEKIETATEESFQAYFVEAMTIPHATLPYKRLAKNIPLPVRIGAPVRKRRKE